MTPSEVIVASMLTNPALADRLRRIVRKPTTFSPGERNAYIAEAAIRLEELTRIEKMLRFGERYGVGNYDKPAKTVFTAGKSRKKKT